MRLLLDTHTFLWLDGSPEQLSPTALVACEEPTNQLYLSVVSAWEIQIKHQINRLQLEVPLDEMIRGSPTRMCSLVRISHVCCHPTTTCARGGVSNVASCVVATCCSPGQGECHGAGPQCSRSKPARPHPYGQSPEAGQRCAQFTISHGVKRSA